MGTSMHTGDTLSTEAMDCQLKVSVSHLMRLLGIDLRSSGRAMYGLHH